jgi:hypothetical protein
MFFLGCSLNSRDVCNRQEDLYSHLHEGFEEILGSVTNQATLLEYLHLDEKDQSLLTRAVKVVFPKAELKRIRKKDSPEMFFCSVWLNV